MGYSWLRTLLSDEMFDHEFAPKQAARIVRNAAQPLFLGELALAGRVGRGLWCLSRLRLGQSGFGIAAGLGSGVRCLFLLCFVRFCVVVFGCRAGVAGLLLAWLGLSLLRLTLSGRPGLATVGRGLPRLARLRRIV